MLSRSHVKAASFAWGGNDSSTVCKPSTRTVDRPPGGDSGKPCFVQPSATRSGTASPARTSGPNSSGDQMMLLPERCHAFEVMSFMGSTSRQKIILQVVEQRALFGRDPCPAPLDAANQQELGAVRGFPDLRVCGGLGIPLEHGLDTPADHPRVFVEFFL